MNRKAEGVSNLIAITRAKVRGDLEMLGSLGKSLEALTFDEHDRMELDEWGNYKEVAEKAQEDRTVCLRALGVLSFIPSATGALQGVTPAGHGKNARKDDRQIHRRRPAMAGARKKGVSEHGGDSVDAALPHHEKENPE